ncbi:MAG: DUF721 domain-containing protein [Candidatus Yanofskybacteria bacterium]|nr:DUF721 domain-containing protein [Candidatus Yanofskybacteria bacterium]
MELLKKRLDGLKKGLEEKEKQDKILRQLLKEVLIKIFETEKVFRYVKSFYFRKDSIFLETKNKSLAQEIHLRQAEIIRQMNQKTKFAVKRIVVK